MATDEHHETEAWFGERFLALQGDTITYFDPESVEQTRRLDCERIEAVLMDDAGTLWLQVDGGHLRLDTTAGNQQQRTLIDHLLGAVSRC
jgi:hypothetical protein